ncbi:MAG: hypothetical protein E7568_00445 [Ruminococcaceae bacterium]|nr:hypothetical protein [Oscillospiraceae bacterium]
MLKSRMTRILIIALLVVFLIYQIYSVLYNPITTSNAQFITETEGINFTGMIIRNEKVIDRNVNGVIHLKVNNGERISKDGVIADIYTSENDSLAVNRIEELKDKIQNIETIQSYNDLAAVDINLLNNKISSTLGEMLYLSANGNINGARKQSDNLLTMMNRKEMVIGNKADFTVQLEGLKNELSSLESSLSQPVNKITAEKSGFFVAQVDGYENVLLTDDLEKYTPEFLDTVTPEKVNSTEKTGKIVSDYTWYIAASITANQALSYKEGDNVKIKTLLKSNPYLSVTVAKINYSADKERATVLFSCQEMNSELAVMRTGSMMIISGEYEGLRIERGALRVNENQTGVYIVSGMELKFVKVKVLYQTEDYVICEKLSASDSTSLRLHDKVVVKGRNLYEGKIIK